MHITLQTTRRIPHGASRLLDATFSWSVKTRPAPSRIRRDACVYGHMTTGMHDNEYPPKKLRQRHLHGIKSKTCCSQPRPSTSGLTSSRTPTETYQVSLGSLEIDTIDKIRGEGDKWQDSFVDNLRQARRPTIVRMSRYTNEIRTGARAQSKKHAGGMP